MNIKLPPAYDISHYEEVPEFSLISPRPVLVITKATEGTTWVDDKFIRYMDGLQAAGIRRGCYHFHRKAYSPVDQALHFVKWCKAAGVTRRDILVLDVEEGGETAGQLQGWFDVVRTTFPQNLVMIYSRKNLLDPISMTESQKVFFRGLPVWTAGYPFDPDLYAGPPASYVPDPTRWGPVWMWQYSDKGIVGGIEGGVDLDWLSPDLLTWLDVPYPSDVIDFPFEGVKRTKGIRLGCNIQVLTIQPGAIREAGFVFPGVCQTIEPIPGDVVANVTGFTVPGCVPNQLLKINGSVIHEQVGTEPYFYWDDAHKLHFDHRSVTLDFLPDASAVKRYLIMEGARNPNPSPAWDEVHPWQLLGAGANGETISILIQAPGFNLYRAAELMIEFGIVWGGDLDSGGSGQTKVAGQVTRCTSEVRSVSNFFFLAIDDNQPPTGEKMYQVKVPTVLRRFRDPNIKGDYGPLPVGMPLDSTEIFDKIWLVLRFSPLPTQDNAPPYVVALADLEFVDDTTPPAGGKMLQYDDAGNLVQTWVPES